VGRARREFQKEMSMRRTRKCGGGSGGGGVMCLMLMLAAVIAAPARGQVRRAVGGGAFGANAAPGPRGTQSLPYYASDKDGNQWMIQQGGWLQSRGNMPVYSQGAMLQINGAQPQQPNNQARWDEKTGDLVLENLQAGNGIQVTRRILVSRDGAGYVRYIDVFKNTTAQEQNLSIELQTNTNYGMQASQTVADPKKPDQNIGWVGQTGAGRCVVEVYSGAGAKRPIGINAQQGNNMVQAQLPLTVPARGEVAIMHLHATSMGPDQGTAFITGLKLNKLLANVPVELRKIIVNFPVGQMFIADREVLRGELFDVIELRGGDTLNGTLGEKSYKLATFYGPVELPAERVVGLINVGQVRPRQLVVTSEGEIFGGKLSKDSIDLQLSSGQTTQVPLSQVSRVGYRKRSGEPEEWALDKPMVVLRTGDRMVITLPAQNIDVLTRYGPLHLDPKAIAAVAFQTDEHGVHEIYMTDGSHFAGLASADQFALTLAASGQKITIPASAMARLQLSAPDEPDNDDNAGRMSLANEDELVGTITGQLKLDTAFDTITVNGPEIRGLAHAKEAGLDVQITLWDGSKLSGQLQEPAVNCALSSGIVVKVPVPLIDSYTQPQPQPSAGMAERIKQTVALLSAEDWKTRDKAEADLVTMGQAVVAVLKQMRPSQPPEAQQRIDSVLKQVEKSGKPQPAAAGAGLPND
jgi:hypothetical protein